MNLLEDVQVITETLVSKVVIDEVNGRKVATSVELTEGKKKEESEPTK